MSRQEERSIKLYAGKAYGHKVSDYALENGYLDYYTLSEIVGDCILNNEIFMYGGYENWELESGLEEDEYGDYTEVYQYYIIEVKALVRKKDFDAYGNRVGRYGPRLDKLVAKSIIFTRELTLDEIFKGYVLEDWWTDEHKKRALEIGVKAARQEIQRDRLVQLGYSETFAALCIAAERDQIAELVASQEGLSMDMKVWTIFNATALNRR